MTVDEIRKANVSAGYRFFDPAHMKANRYRVSNRVWEGPGGVYIVTSESIEQGEGERAPRRYTVRRFDKGTARVELASQFGRYKTIVGAYLHAAKMAHGEGES